MSVLRFVKSVALKRSRTSNWRCAILLSEKENLGSELQRKFYGRTSSLDE